MPIQRIINICPYAFYDDKTSCPDATISPVAANHLCFYRNSLAQVCLKEEPKELFGYARDWDETQTIIQERIKQTQLEK
jgi:hypothetical protein